MSRRRKNRQKPEQPAQAAVEPSTPALPLDDLAALRDRLNALERAQEAEKEAWSPFDSYRRERDEWLKARTRTDHADPCPACGRRGGDQHRAEDATVLGRSAWLCPDCIQAVLPGWGTNVTKMLPEALGRDRLAALAAGMTEPTPSFLAQAARYELTFRLYRDDPGGDGAPWSHLKDRKKWLEVGVKAARRHAAGFGVFPAVDIAQMSPDTVLAPVPTWADGVPTLSMGWRLVDPEPPAPEVLRAQLAAEEKAIDDLLAERKREQARAEKERIAREAAEKRKAEIMAHYQQHVARLEREIEGARASLRAELDVALREVYPGGMH